MTLSDSISAISSLGSADGRSPCVAQDGQTVAPHGQHHAPAVPFSQAGKGLGFADERHLWPSAHWLVGQRRPVVVFGEQSGSADANDWIDLVQNDVEARAMPSGRLRFRLRDVGAPHQRDRAYWVADADRQQWEGRGEFQPTVNLQTAALLASWPTPTATDGKEVLN